MEIKMEDENDFVQFCGFRYVRNEFGGGFKKERVFGFNLHGGNRIVDDEDDFIKIIDESSSEPSLVWINKNSVDEMQLG